MSKIEAATERYFSLSGAIPRFESYNTAPGQAIPVVRRRVDGERELVLLRWGLIPPWSQDTRSGYKMINARAETVGTKPAYRGAFKQRRCLIPADGFFEWRRGTSPKQPHFVRLRDDAKMGLVGIWERWQAGEDEVIESCAIITTEANEAMLALHNRMPAVIAPGAYETWLSAPPGEAMQLLRPYPAEAIEFYPVGLAVNHPANDSPSLLEPVEAA